MVVPKRRAPTDPAGVTLTNAARAAGNPSWHPAEQELHALAQLGAGGSAAMAHQRGVAVTACLSLVFGVQVGLTAQLVRVLMANSC